MVHYRVVLLAILCLLHPSVNAIPLTVGNLLMTRIGDGVTQPTKDDAKYPASIVEIKPDGTFVQQWSLSCVWPYSSNTYFGRITFSDDYSVASLICEDPSTTDKYVYILNQNGELTSNKLTGPIFSGGQVFTAVTDGNDIFVAGYQHTRTELEATFAYATLGSASTVVMIGTTRLGRQVVKSQIINGVYYYAYDQNRFDFYDYFPTTTILPGTTDFITTSYFFGATFGVNDFFMYSDSEIYFASSTDSGFFKAYKDPNGSWQAYSISGSLTSGVTATDIAGERKVFSTSTSQLVSITDTMDGFAGATSSIVLTDNVYILMDVKIIKPGPSCVDNKKNQNETDVDCGGVCGANCADDKACLVDDDCTHKYCTSSLKCATPTCSDTVMNQDETDVDCGGGCDTKCADDKLCKVDGDCLNGYCAQNGKCATPICSDNAKNQNETDVDCGGVCGANCADGQSCLVDNDCTHNYCTSSLKCATPTCDDTVKNQDETDADCGGATCAPCKDSFMCNSDSDCVNFYCTAQKMCETPTCNDAVKNLDETDIDCGGYCGATCALGAACVDNNDCHSLLCTNNKCTESCFDGVMNQLETDIDCGGATCNKCATGSKCKVNTDCQTNLCDSNKKCAQLVPVAPTSANRPQSSNQPQSNPQRPVARTPRGRLVSQGSTVTSIGTLLLVAVFFAF